MAPCVQSLDYAVSYKDTRTRSIKTAYIAPFTRQRTPSKYLAANDHGKKLSKKKRAKVRDNEMREEAAMDMCKFINQHEILKV